ncbi:hypothetical protein D0T53_09085 [Dysgonomonas sp. 216]|uniref:M56 family metallopeptidase n=1 Tax=Dysgonomonas sp. 216 TaxID=2302934 RepID=UPI0013D21B30|nr:M56 family metallopeptidase [Dysgonomonas sp. 216]NDW19065.1 hypothetical protein [Dysgonomonas sp. 216]
MKELIVYLLKSSACISIFLLIYGLFFRQSTFLRFNRAYLLGGLILSFVLPAFRYTYDVVISMSADKQQHVALAGEDIVTVAATSSFDYWILLGGIYLVGLLFVLTRNIKSYIKTVKLHRQGLKIKDEGYRVIDSENIKSPFTVFENIYVNSSGLSRIEYDSVLTHEKTHVKQKHWIDLLCSECALLLQWFNALMWLYVYYQKENHEFLADKAVLDSGVSQACYKAVLINQQFKGPVFSFSNSFSYSNQLNRLKMMKKTKTSPIKKVVLLVLVPVFGVYYWASATPNYIIEDKVYEAEVTATTVKGNSAIDIQGIKGNPLIYVDEKRVTKEELGSMVLNRIEEVEVLKDEEAMEQFGPEAKDGVLKLYSKKREGGKANNVSEPLGKKTDATKLEIVMNGADAEGDVPKTKKVTVHLVQKDDSLKMEANQFFMKNDSGEKVQFFVRCNETEKPVFIIDDVEQPFEKWNAIDSDSIKEIVVLKEKAAEEKYGDKGKNGVVIVKMKKMTQ